MTTAASSARDTGEKTPLARLRALSGMRDGWDGAGSIAPSVSALKTAHTFLAKIDHSIPPRIGPSPDGNVVFEWDLKDDFAVYCDASKNGIAIHAFDSANDFISLTLPPEEAATVVRAVLTAKA